MASTVSEVRNSISESNKSMEVHSGDDDSGAEDVSPRKTEESSEDISEAEENSKVKEVKTGQSSADESSEGKGSEGDEEPVKVEKVAQAKKESQPKASSRTKKNGTAAAPAITADLDTNAAEQVKSEGSRRERKQVERFSIAAVAPTEKAIVVPHGSGTKLGDIPIVAHEINKIRSDDLGYLHRLLYNKRGHTAEIKKNLRLFSGFEFDESSSEYQKKKAQLTKWKPNIIKQLCEVLGLLKKGTKEQVVERILEFCLVPKDSGLKPKVKAKKSSSSKKSATPKSKSKASSSSKSKPKTKAPKKSKKSSDADVSDEENVPDKDEKRRRSVTDDDEEDQPPRKRSREGPTRQAATGKRYVEVDESDSEPQTSRRKKASPVKAKKPRQKSPSSADESKSSESEAEAPELEPEPMSEDEEEKSKKSKSSSKSSPKKTKPAPSAKSKPVVSKKAKSSDSESEQDDEEKGSSKEEEDTSKSTDIPSDEKLKEFVKNMMKTANLKKVTMKTLMQDVATAFPQVDLTSKKSYIKDCVNEALESAGS